MKSVVPIVMVTGTAEFPRFFISAAEPDGFPKVFWHGIERSWVTDRNDATLFPSIYEVCRECQRIQVDQFEGKTRRKFVVPVAIDLFDDGEVDENDLKEWLQKVVHFSIAYGSCGNGPTDTSLAICNLIWDHFQQVTSVSDFRK